MSLRNWLRMRLQRLKQPKYFAGAAYFWFFFLRRNFVSDGAAAGSGPRHALQQAGQAMETAGLGVPHDFTGVPLMVGALALIVIVTLAWVLSLERASLGFTE